MRPRPSITASPLLLLLTSVFVLPAGEPEKPLLLVRRPLTEAIGVISDFAGPGFVIDPDLARHQPSVSLRLLEPDPARARQALAHAAGVWWLDELEPLLTRSPRLPLSRDELRVESYESRLLTRHDAEPLVEDLLRPWLGDPACGIGHDPFTGTWSATLGPEGHAELRGLLGLLDHGQPQVPTLLPLPAETPARRVPSTVRASDRHNLLLGLATAADIDVAIGPGILLADARTGPRDRALRIGPGELPGICRDLEQLGIHHRMIRGVLCFDTEAPEDRQHPARRRRLAVLPLGHLLEDPAAADILLAELEATVNPPWWARPGAGLVYLKQTRSLLAAADDYTLSLLLDELIRREQTTE